MIAKTGSSLPGTSVSVWNPSTEVYQSTVARTFSTIKLGVRVFSMPSSPYGNLSAFPCVTSIVGHNGDNSRHYFEVMSRSTRLLELLIVLQTKTRFTVAEMAADFAVSRRTMLRDLQALSEMGVPLAASPGPGGGYSLIRGRNMLPLSLSADEAIGVILSYEAFQQHAQSPFA